MHAIVKILQHVMHPMMKIGSKQFATHTNKHWAIIKQIIWCQVYQYINYEYFACYMFTFFSWIFFPWGYCRYLLEYFWFVFIVVGHEPSSSQSVFVRPWRFNRIMFKAGPGRPCLLGLLKFNVQPLLQPRTERLFIFVC